MSRDHYVVRYPFAISRFCVNILNETRGNLGCVSHYYPLVEDNLQSTLNHIPDLFMVHVELSARQDQYSTVS